MNMKFLSALTLVSALSAALLAAPLPDTNWEVKNGKIRNWSGKVTRTKDNAMEFSKTTYTMRKYLRGKSKSVKIKLDFQGKHGQIGMYLYNKSGAWLGTVNTTRIPNADQKRSFDIRFKIPEKAGKNQDAYSFRIFFFSPQKSTISKFSMELE